MKFALPLFLGVLLFAYFAHGGSTPCEISAAFVDVSDSTWQCGNSVSELFDVSVTNSGPCAIRNMTLHFTVPNATFSVISTWNLNFLGDNATLGLEYAITNFGDILHFNHSVNLGFILQFSNTKTVPTGLSIDIVVVCDKCASGSFSSSLPSSPTSSSTCNLVSTLTPRAGSSYLTGNGIAEVYDISISNLGACTATSIDLTISTPGVSIISLWKMKLASKNLRPQQGSQYSLNDLNGGLLPGKTAVSGFIVFFPNTQTVPTETNLTLAVLQCETICN